MNREQSADDRIAAWLEGEAPGQLPDRVLHATFERTRAGHQSWRRGRGLRWRNRPMSLSARIVTAAAAVLIGVVGIGVIGRGFESSIGGPEPTPSDSPNASESATPARSVRGSTFAVTLQAPASWEVVEDVADWFYLASPNGAYTNQGMHILRGAAIPIRDEACTVQPDPTRGDRVTDFVDYVGAHSNFERSQTHDVTIGGLSGVTLDLVLLGSLPYECQYDDLFGALYLAQEVGTSWSSWTLGPDEYQRVAFLEDGQGRVTVVVISARGKTEFDRMTADAAPILDSLRFITPP